MKGISSPWAVGMESKSWGEWALEGLLQVLEPLPKGRQVLGLLHDRKVLADPLKEFWYHIQAG